MKRFRLANLLWILLLVAVCANWLRDHQRGAREIQRSEAEIDAIKNRPITIAEYYQLFDEATVQLVEPPPAEVRDIDD